MAASSKEVAAFLKKLRRSTRNVPIIGKHVARIGRIQEIIDTPCGNTPALFFSFAMTAPDNLMFALATVFKPSPTDAMMSRFTRGHRGAPPMRDGYQKRQTDLYKGLNRIFNLPVHTGKDGLQKSLIRGAELGRLVGWYMIVAEATTAGLVRWTSAAFQMSGCNPPPVVSTNKRHPYEAAIFGGVWVPLTSWYEDAPNKRGWRLSSGGQKVHKKLLWNITFTAQGGSHGIDGIPASTINFRLKLYTSDGKEAWGVSHHEGTKRNPDHTVSHIISLSSQELGSNIEYASPQYCIEGPGYARIYGATLTYTASENPYTLKPDP